MVSTSFPLCHPHPCFLAEQSPQRCYCTCELDTTRLCRPVVWATSYLNTRHHRGLVGDELVCVCVCLWTSETIFIYDYSTIIFFFFFMNSSWTWKIKWWLISIEGLLVKTRTRIGAAPYCISRVVCSGCCVPTTSSLCCVGQCPYWNLVAVGPRFVLVALISCGFPSS